MSRASSTSGDRQVQSLMVDSPAAVYDGSREGPGFVGPPARLGSIRTPHQRETASHGSNFPDVDDPRTPQVARPSLGIRSISSPHPPFLGNATNSSTPQSIFGFQDANISSTPRRDRQWTLFGQLMENEGYSSPMSSERTAWRSNQPYAHVNLSQGLSTTSPGGSMTGSGPLPDVQSPVGDESTAGPRADYIGSASCLPPPSETSSSDEEYDSDTPTVDRPLPSHDATTLRSKTPWYSTHRLPTIPVVYRGILKCAIAYFVASLFTYSPYLSGFVSDITSYRTGQRKPSPSGHMVATIAVYFNPAKTMGAMFEADLFCLCGLLYASFVCLCSMSLFWWFELKPGWEWLGDVIAILWIGVSMSAVAWMKVYMASPQFSTACSMIAIILFVVIVREGGLQTLLQVSFIVLCGSVVSNIACYLIWPQTATTNLQTNMTKTLDSFSTLLSMLTDAFLLEDGLHHPRRDKLQKAVQNHQNSFTSLKKNLGEARSEWFYAGPGSRTRDEHVQARHRSFELGRGNGNPPGASLRAYEDAVDSLTRLAQHLNGLRSGTRLQYELTKAGVMEKRGSKTASIHGQVEDEENALLKAAAAMFGDLVDDLGPPLKALSAACTHSIRRLRDSFVQSRTHHRRRRDMIHPEEFMELVEAIERALLRFESTSNHAVLRLYRRSDMLSTSHTESLADNIREGTPVHQREGNENSFLATGNNEHVFLVYYFIFTLQEFARELVSLIDAMERIYILEQERLLRGPWWKRIFGDITSLLGRPFSKSRHKERKLRPSLRRSLSHIVPGSRQRRHHPSFPKVKPHAPNTIQTPSRTNLSLIGKIMQTLWAIGNRLQERDAKYAIKAGMATAILAAPAFLDSTRQFFVEWWGDWALISFFVVLSPTIGATNFLSFHRVFGTVLGATVAAGIYHLFPENAIVLSIFGFFFSLPCFYFIVAKPQYISAGRFVLLTYNLTCLYCYNLRNKDVSAVFVAWHRAVSVTAGVVFAAFISRVWWPAEARRELGKALGEFCLNIGWLYTRLVASNSYAPDTQDDRDHGVHNAHEEGSLLTANPKLSSSIREFMSMELHLQIKLIELQGLLAQTQHEPRLKGPFPVQLYRGVLTSLQTILDRLHSMRCVTTREEWYTHVRKDFIIPVNKERHEMVGNIILSFSTLASAFRLKAPLPPYLPPAEKARQRLVDAIRRLDVVRNREVKGSKHLLFFAYALNLKGVTEELESLGKTLQNAFGVIGQTPEEFEALFADAPENGISYAA